jgi:hypothetical protein
MSYPMPGQPPSDTPRTRPGTVTASSWLLFLVAAIYVISFVAVVSTMGTVMDVYRNAYAGTEMEGTEGIAVATTVGSSVLFLLIAAGLVVLGLLNNRGKNPARVVTWVVGGLALCCNGAGLALQGIMTSLPTPEDVEGPDPMEVQRQVEAALPDWYMAFSLASQVVTILALIVALILLALPPSNEFFRKPPPAYQPPPYPTGN